ncbi:endonuclease/exonuclease/phosphatase family protein [Poriferisphaera sp. WC338]|uniref:endonuclease/exonuclease/phosphatase family protein n=1 Tax=Poriferisphaera sp. WC338 TaxID=3425129 RepID=UPI003D8197B5
MTNVLNRTRRIVFLLMGFAMLGSLMLDNPVMAEDEHIGRIKLRIMCFNIHHGEGTDGELDLDRIAEVIKANEPDVVMLQEVDSRTTRSGGEDQVAVLAELTGMHGIFGPAISYDNGQYGNAILSRFPINSHRNYKLPRPNKKEQRAVLTIRVKLAKGTYVRFGSTHLQHTHLESRVKQAKWINERLVKNDEAFILSGDFNAEPGDQAINLLDKMWNRVGEQDDLATFPAGQPQKTIDHVYLRNTSTVSPIKAWVVDSGKASDHRPLMVELDLKIKRKEQ